MDNSNRFRRSPRFIDRISELPDSILGQILSHLPTKMAACTNVLSKRWRYIYPYQVQPLNLQLIQSRMGPISSFENFVHRLLIEKTPKLPCLNELFLVCDYMYKDDTIISWICSALERSVRRLTLYIDRLYESFRVFDRLNRCTTLVELHFKGLLDLRLPPGKFSLPNLKTMSLENLLFHRETASIRELLDGCPALEHLTISCCNLRLLEILRIQSNLLKYLKLDRCIIRRCKLLLDVPNLETLFVYGGVAADYTISCFHSLRTADIGTAQIGIYNQYFDDCVAKLVTACLTTNCLRLFSETLVMLEHSSLPLPTFHNLNDLTLGSIRIGELLARLLQSAPHLKVITFNQELYTSDYATFESLLPCVPHCVKNHVEKSILCHLEGKKTN